MGQDNREEPKPEPVIQYIPCPIEICTFEAWISEVDPDVSHASLWGHVKVDHADFDDAKTIEIMSRVKPVYKEDKEVSVAE